MPSLKSITVQVVTWNSSPELSALLPILQEIPADRAQFVFVDNASSDNSVEQIQRALPQAKVIELKENIGFGNAHNLGFTQSETELVLALNPDVQLDWAGIEKVAEAFYNEKVASAQGKLLRSEKVIDSVGVALTATLNGCEVGAGETDLGQYEIAREIVAATGACALYRVSALKKVAHQEGEFFDENFFAYKEDVDLGWRLQRAGFVNMYIPVFVGWHERHQRHAGFWGWGLNPINIYRRLQNKRTRWSLRNWIWMIVKNATPQQMLLHGLLVDLRSALFFVFSLLYWPLLSVWPETFRGIPKMIAKRGNNG